jgi:hypothetical protein
MRKLLTLALALALTLTLAACGGGNDTPTTTPSGGDSAAPTSSQEENETTPPTSTLESTSEIASSDPASGTETPESYLAQFGLTVDAITPEGTTDIVLEDGEPKMLMFNLEQDATPDHVANFNKFLNALIAVSDDGKANVGGNEFTEANLDRNVGQLGVSYMYEGKELRIVMSVDPSTPAYAIYAF